MKCLECKTDLIQTPGKRPKQFCDSTCRSNYWQKENRKNNPKVKVKVGDKIGKSVVTKVEESKDSITVTGIIPPPELTGMALELWIKRQKFLKK